ncbi:hypothetical protein OAT28_03555 [Gammaproteobacteria bacterium]|nr:hypothetical protein [Gammaproteobacteria bacterium]
MPITQRLATIVFITLLLWSGTSSAQTQPENEEAVAGAMAALDEFMITFNARNSQLWARSLNYPHVRFASGTVTVWESAEKFAQTDSFNRLAAIGWDHSHWLSRNVVLVSPAKVHIATKFQRFNEKNESIGTYESLYIVTKVDGHWGTQARSSLAP